MGCFSGKKGKKKTEVKLPEHITAGSKDVMSAANAEAGRAYQPYEYQRVAGFSDDQLAAQDAIRGMKPSTDYDVAGSQAMDAINREGLTFENGNLLDDKQGGNLDAYMNPYINQVIERAMAGFDREGAKARMGVNQRATLSNSFGDARHGVEGAEMERNLMNTKGDYMANALRDAFSNAQAMKGADMNRDQTAFNSNVSAQEQALQRIIAGNRGEQGQHAAWADMLDNSGRKQQSMDQVSFDTAYQDFQNQLGHGKAQAEWLASILGGLPMPTTTTTTEKAPQGSTVGQIAGLAGSVGSLFV